MAKNRKVMLIGAAMTKPIGRDFRDYRQHAAEPFFWALDELELKPKDIEVISVGYNERTTPDGAISPIMSDVLSGLNAPVIPVSAACAGGGVAAWNLYHYISSGRYDIGACVSYSQTEAFYPGETANALGNFTDLDFSLGLTHFHYSFMREKYYQQKYQKGDLTAEAHWARQDHWYGRRNPEAVTYGSPMPTEEALFADGILGVRTRSAAGRNHACTLIFASEDVAKNFEKPIFIDLGLANRSAYMGAHFNYPHADHRDCDISRQPGTTVASRRALTQAEAKIDDIDVFQVHDLTPSDGFMQMEALGIAAPGEMGKLVLEGVTAVDGKYPTNTDGGNIAFGHSSVGGDFSSKIVENMKQIRGQCDERQVKDVELALAQAYGTHQSVDAVAIMRRGF